MMNKKSPQLRRLSDYRLTWKSTASNLVFTRYTLSIPDKPPMCTSVSPKHCEFVNPILLVALQERQKTSYQEWIKDRPLSSTTDITGNGDELEGRVQTNHTDVWKVGELSLK